MSSQLVNLKVDFCNHQAAKYAVEHWHYSKTMPVGKMVKVGVWENGNFIGVVIFARGNSPTLGQSYGLKQEQVCELVRVALTIHKTEVSKIVTIAIKKLKANNPDLRLIVSFADPAENHNGSIYQAMNWVYNGQSEPSWQWLHNGRWKHNREITSGAFGKGGAIKNYKELPKRQTLGKFRYLMPLDKAMRRQIIPLAKPYPKRKNMRLADGSNLATSEARRFDSDQAALNHTGKTPVLIE